MKTPTDPPRHRAPRAVAFEEPREKNDKARRSRPVPPRRPQAVSDAVMLTAPEDDPFLAPPEELPPARPAPRRRLTAGKVLAASLALLASLAVGYWIDQLVRDLFDRLPWLGWAAAGLAVVAALALLAVVWREFRGLRRLAKVHDLQAHIVRAAPAASPAEARELAARISAFLGNRPQTARGRAALAALEGEIVDGPQLLAFAERELLGVLDREARALVIGAARRVSVVTAVSPRAIVDVLYVGWEAVRLVRSIAVLYGGRPGTFGMVRLFRDVIAHLAVTGTVAAGDSLIQQAIGHGIAAKLSARLGEGVINGLMTARIGLSAMDLCRPMPFAALKRPRVSDVFTDLTAFAAKKNDAGTTP